jgi:hypothetical protein
MVFRRRKTFRKRRSLKKRRTMRKRIMKGGVIKYGEFSGLPQTGQDVKTILGDLDRNSFDEEAIDFTKLATSNPSSYPIFWYKNAIWLTSSTYPRSNFKFNIINKNGNTETIDTKDPEFQRDAILLKRRWPSTASMNQ